MSTQDMIEEQNAILARLIAEEEQDLKDTQERLSAWDAQLAAAAGAFGDLSVTWVQEGKKQKVGRGGSMSAAEFEKEVQELARVILTRAAIQHYDPFVKLTISKAYQKRKVRRETARYHAVQRLSSLKGWMNTYGRGVQAGPD